MALGNEVENVTDLLEKTTVKQLNVVSLADKGRKLDTAEDGVYTNLIVELLYKISIIDFYFYDWGYTVYLVVLLLFFKPRGIMM